MERPNEDMIKYPLSVEVQFSIGEILAEHYGAELAYTIVKEGDLNAVLLKRRRPLIAFEVKIGKVNEKSVKRGRKIAQRLEFLSLGQFPF